MNPDHKPTPVAIKVCGLTRTSDIDAALSLGIQYLGFNAWPHSPRSVSIDTAQALVERVPETSRVVVDVEPDEDTLRAYAPYFHFFQIHFSQEIPSKRIEAWADIVSPERLWLAPKLPPETPFPEELFQYAHTFLIDTYQKHGYGGSGKTGNWEYFSSLKEKYPDKQWILAGGLNPDNISDAARTSHTAIVDVNSGIEDSPGIKNREKLEALIQQLAV